MARVAGTEELMDAEFIADLFNELADVIEGESPTATSCLNQFINHYSSGRLQDVKDLFHGKNIPIIVHHELREQRTRNGLQDSSNHPVYKFVMDRLDDWTSESGDIESMNGRPGQGTHDSNGVMYKLVEWSAILWFVQQLRNSADEATKIKIFTYGTKRLFMKYFSEEPIRCEVDFLKGVMEMVGELMEQALEEFLKKWENVEIITRGGLSKDMTIFLSKHSKKTYIIPFPIGACRMYAMHLYMRAFDESVDDDYTMKPGEHADLEAKQIQRNLEDGCGFQFIQPPLRGIYNPNIGDHDKVWNPDSGTFQLLKEWIIPELTAIKDTCSMLFISFSMHGIQAHLQDCNLYKRIQEIMEWIHPFEELRPIPKVVAIQACQHVPGAEGPEDESTEEEAERTRTREKFEEISDELEYFVKDTMNNMTLIMAVERGEQYEVSMPPNTAKEADTYLTRLVKFMADSSETKPPTVLLDAHQRAHKDDENKAKQTVTESVDNKSIMFLHAAPEKTPEYTVWQHDAENSLESDEENQDQESSISNS